MLSDYKNLLHQLGISGSWACQRKKLQYKFMVKQDASISGSNLCELHNWILSLLCS